MKSPARRFINYDLISALIIRVCLKLVTVSGSGNHCSDHKFTTNTAYMQFTKETVSEEYAIEGEFKNLHCCAKGYRSIEWFKDGRQYPWSSEAISSLILYPKASNQTIYARHVSKVDEGRYKCVLRNDTHKMEHHVKLTVLDSSPDIPLATFIPGNQFANLGGTARFFCEAFVGKKDLPDISISIKWYHVTDDNQQDHLLDLIDQQEIVKREEEQIIGSYLNISEVTMDHFGRYLCRVEIGSKSHRLEMSAELINALPIAADKYSILWNPYFLAACAALITISLFFLVLHSRRWCTKHVISLNANELEIFNMKAKDLEPPPPAIPKLKKSSAHAHRRHDDTSIMNVV